MNCYRNIALSVGLLVLGLLLPIRAESQMRNYNPPLDSTELSRLEAGSEVTDSSGLALSVRNPKFLWTHNDQGFARLFVFNRDAFLQATVTVRNARCVDWEDTASFELAGKPWLMVADTGDDLRSRSSLTLYLIEEPEVKPLASAASRPASLTVNPSCTIDLKLPQGPRDIEALAVDSFTREVLLFTKDPSGTKPQTGSGSQVYRFVLPDLASLPPQYAVLAEPIASIPLLQATGAAISPDRSRLVLVSYTSGFYFDRHPDASWAQTLSAPGVPVMLPQRRQGEAVCFDLDNASIILTSEGAASSIKRIPLPAYRQPAFQPPVPVPVAATEPLPEPE
jgi:hypothetical protein